MFPGKISLYYRTTPMQTEEQQQENNDDVDRNLPGIEDEEEETESEPTTEEEEIEEDWNLRSNNRASSPPSSLDASYDFNEARSRIQSSLVKFSSSIDKLKVEQIEEFRLFQELQEQKLLDIQKNYEKQFQLAYKELYETFSKEIHAAELELCQWNKHKKIMKERFSEENSLSSGNEIVSLNIGGVVYSTTIDTLRKPIMNEEHLFCAMFSGRFQLDKDKSGNIFIDRDGYLFKYILNYMRARGNIEDCFLPPEKSEKRKALAVEAGYYNLTHLYGYLTGSKNIKFNSRYCHQEIIIHEGEETISKILYGYGTVLTTFQALPNTSSKWHNYFEVTQLSTDSCIYIGVIEDVPLPNNTLSRALGDTKKPASYAFKFKGLKESCKSSKDFGEECFYGDRVGIWFDTAKGILRLYRNGKCLGIMYDKLGINERWIFAVSLGGETKVSIVPGAKHPDLRINSSISLSE